MNRAGTAIALIALALAGCGNVSIHRVGRGAALAAGSLERGLHNGGGGGVMPEPIVRDDGPTARAPADPATRSLLDDAADAHRAARGSERASRAIADAYDLAAMAGASTVLAAGPNGPAAGDAVAIYNAALRSLLRRTGGRRPRFGDAWADSLAASGPRVSILRDGSTWDPDRFDEFLFADDYAVSGLDPHSRTPGLGVTLVGIRKFRPNELRSRQGADKFLMPREVYAVTAVLRVVSPGADGPPEVRLELHDPFRSRAVDLGGGDLPLATDLSTPLAYQFVRGPLPILQEIGLLDPQWLEGLSGLYTYRPYRPGKIPVVLVHGLRSSPLAWMKVLNALQDDPALRDRYQFWLFLYPTGMPFPLSAARLRAGFAELRDAIDPEHADLALDRAVLIGHSMGGLIANMMVVESGDALWRLVARRPFDELRTDDETRQTLRDVFFFDPVPSIRRVVYIATPHRGSVLGEQFIGRLTDRLIRLPSPLRSTYRRLLAANDAEFFTDDFRDHLPSSIDELKPDTPLLTTLLRLPVNPGVTFHSIIGRRHPDDPLEASGDGVVRYTSAHIDTAASERVVHGDHGCQDGPETIAELRRILTLHLADAPPLPAQAARPSATISR